MIAKNSLTYIPVVLVHFLNPSKEHNETLVVDSVFHAAKTDLEQAYQQAKKRADELNKTPLKIKGIRVPAVKVITTSAYELPAELSLAYSAHEYEKAAGSTSYLILKTSELTQA